MNVGLVRNPQPTKTPAYGPDDLDIIYTVYLTNTNVEY